MARILLVMLVIWIGAFIVFWNVKRWKWSVARTLMVALGTAVASGAFLTIVYLLVTTLGD